jgi:hypothetical protein
MKTTPIKALVREALGTLPTPYSEHVIDEVFHAIEAKPEWRAEYDSLCQSFTKTVVNNWGGYWIANALGKVGDRVVPSTKSSLIGSYSILDTDAKTIVKKPKESEALQLMADYYQKHKASLPHSVRGSREQIVELIMEGHTPQEAFEMVLRNTGAA